MYDEKRNGFVVEAMEDHKRGDEIFNTYGRKCNTRYMLNFGFSFEENDANETPFRLDMHE